jgi:hypothetical protein
MEPFPRTDHHDLSSASPSSETPTNIVQPALQLHPDAPPIEHRLLALIRENVTHVSLTQNGLRGVALEFTERSVSSRDTSESDDGVPLIKMSETMSPIGIANVSLANGNN